MVIPSFLFGYQEYLLRSTFSDTFKPRKNISVLVSIGDRKSVRISGDAQNVCAITIVGTVLKKKRTKLTFRALALRQRMYANCFMNITI